MSDKLVTLLRTQVATLEREAAEAARREVCAEVQRVLDRYNDADEGETPECAPEDRWRLYRDLRRLVGEPAPDEQQPV